jgi:dCMP deaminase
MNKPDWNIYFLTLCYLVAQRSIDQSTKHGCVVVAQDKTILSTGYNGPPRGFPDEEFPQERPLKYSYVVHSETNAIANAARHGICLKDSTFYITGFPCPNCMHSIINVGAKKIIHGIVGSNCVTDETRKIVEHLNKGPNLEIVQFNDFDIPKILDITKTYYYNKYYERK